MALETLAILKEIYRVLLKTDNMDEARQAIRVMLDEEHVAYVEKIVTEKKKK